MSKLKALFVLIVFGLSVLALLSCSNDSSRTSPSVQIGGFYPGDIVSSGTISGTNYHIYSHKSLLETFQKQTSGLTPLEKREVWKKEVLSKIGEKFYRDYVFSELSETQFNDQFDAYLDKQFEFLTDANFDRIIGHMSDIENGAEDEVRRVLESYGKIGDDLHVIITSIGHAGGKARLINESSDQPMLFLMVNNMVSYKPEITSSEIISNTIPHELTHCLHLSLNSHLGDAILPESFMADGQYYWGLLLEGVAMYGDKEILPRDNSNRNLTDAVSYEGLTDADIAVLAEEFLKIYNQPAFPEGKETEWPKWFSATDEKIAGKQYPNAVGYFLGYRVIDNIISNDVYTYRELLELDLKSDAMKSAVQEALVQLTAE